MNRLVCSVVAGSGLDPRTIVLDGVGVSIRIHVDADLYRYPMRIANGKRDLVEVYRFSAELSHPVKIAVTSGGGAVAEYLVELADALVSHSVSANTSAWGALCTKFFGPAAGGADEPAKNEMFGGEGTSEPATSSDLLVAGLLSRISDLDHRVSCLESDR